MNQRDLLIRTLLFNPLNRANCEKLMEMYERYISAIHIKNTGYIGETDDYRSSCSSWVLSIIMLGTASLSSTVLTASNELWSVN